MSGRVFDKYIETQHWTRAFAHDGRDPRSWLQTKLCRSWNRVALQTNTERGSVARGVFFAYTVCPETVFG